MNLINFWLLGSVIVALDIYYTLYDDPTVFIRYKSMDNLQKTAVIVQLALISFIGSWLIIAWRLSSFIYFNYLRRRK